MEIKAKQNYSYIIDKLLYYGNKKPALNDEELSNIGIKAIICLLPKDSQIQHDPNKFIVLNINTEDSILCSLNEWAQKTSDFIEQNINENKPIYVHCAQGISRSTACILHYLMTKKGMTLKESFNMVKSKRIVASPTVGFFKDLIDLDIKLFGNSSMSLEDYSLMMLHENFPSLDKNDIDKTYYKYHDLYKNGEKKDKYEKEMNENRYEPIGYHTIDELINGIGKEKFTKRKGASIHHPFD